MSGKTLPANLPREQFLELFEIYLKEYVESKTSRTEFKANFNYAGELSFYTLELQIGYPFKQSASNIGVFKGFNQNFYNGYFIINNPRQYESDMLPDDLSNLFITTVEDLSGKTISELSFGTMNYNE
jgi:hypothetical protein